MNLRPRLLLLTVLLLASVQLAVAQTDDLPTAAHYAPTDGWPTPLGWPEYGGSLSRHGRSPTDGPDAATNAVTPATLSDRSFSAPVIGRTGHVYVGTTDGKVHVYTAGLEKVWSSPALGGPVRSSVLVGPEGSVYVAHAGGELVALDGAGGKVLWRLDIGNSAPADEYVVTGAPAWHPDGFIVQGSMDGRVYAVTPDGKELWRFGTHTDLDNKVVATAAIRDDGRIYIGSQNGRLYALDATGQQVWMARTSGLTSSLCREEQQVAAPSFEDDIVYVATRLKGCGNAGMAYAFEDQGDKAKLLWSRQLADKATAPVTVGTGQHVYIGALDGTFYALKKTDGAIAWTFRPQDDDPRLRDAVGVSIAVSAAELAIVDASGRLYVPYWNVDFSQGFPPDDSLASPFYVLDKDGDIEWRRVFDHAPRSAALMPTQSGPGVLYIAGDDAKLHAIGKDPIPPEIPEEADVPEPLPSATTPSPTESSPAPENKDAPGPPLVALVVLATMVAAYGRTRSRP